MTGVIIRSDRQSDVLSNQSGVRMKFWGVCCIGGKAYKQVVNYRFHLTMAVLDPKSYDREVRDRTVTLSVIQHGKIFLLCVLKHGEIQQVNLNLIFDKGDDVTFSVGGYGTVHLTGYQLIDSSDIEHDMDNEQYCPVAELGSVYPAVNGVETKNKEKTKSKLKKVLMGASGNDDEEDDDDDDDSDFSVEFDGVEGIGVLSSEDDSESEEDVEIEESELLALHEDDSEIESPAKSEGTQKRKLGNFTASLKRVKKEPESESEKMDEVSHGDEDNESDSDEGAMNSSIGNTPMPNKIGKAKKKLKKKKKRLSEISNIGSKSEDTEYQTDYTSPESETSKKKSEFKPIKKIEGGVEYQDIEIGSGPKALPGKVVSVFYVGRLDNKHIFDSRVPAKKPFSFKLGIPEVIKGLDIGIKGMKVGGKRRLKVPPNMGYGTKDIEGVPSNSTLYFTVELVSVN